MGQLSQECPLKMVFLVVAQDGVLGSGGSRVGMWVRLWANTSYGHSCLRVNEIGTKVACMAMNLCSTVQGRPVDRGVGYSANSRGPEPYVLKHPPSSLYGTSTCYASHHM